MPRVTVLMAVYNGERYLREAIESILGQTFQDFEFLIVNDGSTDSTRDVIRSYDDPRIRLVDNERNLGLARSLNRGLELAQGEFIARQDADDVSEPERLARQVAFLETHAEVALLGTWYKKIDARGTLIGNRMLPCDYTGIRWSLLFFCPFVHSAVMLRTSTVLGQVGFYNEALTYSMDYEFWTRIARRMPVANLDEYLVRLRTNPGSMTATYGDRTQEGHRIRIAAVTDLLGWDKTDIAFNELRFNTMTALILGTHANVDRREAERMAAEILRLHAAFCRSYAIDQRECAMHYAKLRSQLGRRFIELAHRCFDQDDAVEARQLQGAARDLNRSILFTKSYIRLFFKLLLGPRFVKALRRSLPGQSATHD